MKTVGGSITFVTFLAMLVLALAAGAGAAVLARRWPPGARAAARLPLVLLGTGFLAFLAWLAFMVFGVGGHMRGL